MLGHALCTHTISKHMFGMPASTVDMPVCVCVSCFFFYSQSQKMNLIQHRGSLVLRNTQPIASKPLSRHEEEEENSRKKRRKCSTSKAFPLNMALELGEHVPYPSVRSDGNRPGGVRVWVGGVGGFDELKLRSRSQMAGGDAQTANPCQLLP